MADDTTYYDPSEVPPSYLKPISKPAPSDKGIITPPKTDDPYYDPSEVPPNMLRPVDPGTPDPGADTMKKTPYELPWWATTPIEVGMQTGGELLGAAGGAAAGGLLGTAELPVVGTVTGAGAGAEAGAAAGVGAGQVGAKYLENAISRAIGEEPEPVDPTREFESGVGQSVFARQVAPFVMHYVGVPAARKLLSIEERTKQGQEAADAAAKDLEENYGTVQSARRKAESRLAQPEAETANRWATDQIQQRLGTTTEEQTGKLAGTATPSGREIYALEHVDAQNNVLHAANRPFEQVGQQIGQAWQPYLDTPVETGSFTDSYENIVHPPAGQKTPGTFGAATAGLLKRFNDMGSTQHQTAGNVLDMARDVEAQMAKTKSPADLHALAQMKFKLMDILTDDEVVPPAGKAQLRPLNATYRSLKDWITGGDFTSFRNSKSPGDTFESFWKMGPQGTNSVLQSATPDELGSLRGSAAQFITGNKEGDEKGIIDRVGKMYAENPEGYKALFKGTPMEDPRALARTPIYAARVANILQDPKYQKIFNDGMLEAMDSPEVAQFRKALDKYHTLPDPEQARMDTILSHYKNPGENRFVGYLKRRSMFDGMVALMSAGHYGMIARNPQIGAMIFGGIASREMVLNMIAKHPEEYWNFVSKIGTGVTPESVRLMGRAAARLGMSIAMDGVNTRAQAATNAVGPEQVILPPGMSLQ